jgi:RHS repeat-associated protein
MTDNAGGVYSFNYDDANRPTARTLPNGIGTTASYDGLSRLDELKHSLASTTVSDFRYTYNSASDITQITEPTRTRGFTYDGVDRLATVTNSAGSNESYDYDSVGNRTSSHLSSSYGLQPFNKIVSTQSATYTYDGNGNMTSRWDATGRWYFTWDSENRLVRVLRPGWRPVSYRTITYSYDALGRRIERSSKTSGTERYTYDGQDVVLEQKSSGAQTTYINGPGIDNKLKQTSGGVSSYFLQDHLGSTTALTNASGAVTSSATYDGYGRQTGTVATRYGYTGRELDPDTGLMFYRARWYDPTLGRFITVDPIGLADGINYYAYVRNNPLLFWDPSGLQRCNPLVGRIVGALVGGGIGYIGGFILGPVIGAELGALLVGGVGSTVGPEGTVIGGVGGAAVGAAIGALTGPWVGTAIGAYAGAALGNAICSGGGPAACDSAPVAPPIPTASPRVDPLPFPTPTIFPIPSPTADKRKWDPTQPFLPPPLPWAFGRKKKEDECFEKCQHLLGNPWELDLQSSPFTKCYKECMGRL